MLTSCWVGLTQQQHHLFFPHMCVMGYLHCSTNTTRTKWYWRWCQCQLTQVKSLDHVNSITYPIVLVFLQTYTTPSNSQSKRVHTYTTTTSTVNCSGGWLVWREWWMSKRERKSHSNFNWLWQWQVFYFCNNTPCVGYKSTIIVYRVYICTSLHLLA